MTTTPQPETGATRTGSGVALIATALAVAVVGFGVGVGAPAAVAAVGGALLWPTARWETDDGWLRDRVTDAVGTPDDDTRTLTAAAATAVAVVHGLTAGLALTALAGPVAFVLLFVGGLAETATVVVGAFAVSAVALEGAVGFDRSDDLWAVDDGLLARLTNPLLGLTVAGVTLTTVVIALAAGGVGAADWLAAGGVGPFGLAVLLQATALGLALLAPHVERSLSALVGPDRFESPALLSALGRAPEEVPRGYWLALGAQVLLVWSGFGLPAVWPGGVVGFVLGGVLPGVAVAALALALTVVGVWGLVAFVLAASGDDGPFVVRTVASFLPAAAGTLLVTVPLSFQTPYVAAVTVPLGIGVGAVGVRLGGHLLSLAARFGPLTGNTAGFGIGAGLVATLAPTAALSGAPAPTVYVAVAAALACWYAGELAAGLGTALGRDADTAAGEAAHAVGLGVVLVGALAVVTGLTYFLSVPAGLAAGPQTAAAVVLLVVAAATVVARETVVRDRG